ncbi:hypothetical protein ABT352_18195 [Streptosporangium sp. NPDC000563]|uniref:hypothetical protein n=1 Tax=Streptosporangium sp. NPDC000563 TaxID=3154366 RepID=UPI0033184480
MNESASEVRLLPDRLAAAVLAGAAEMMNATLVARGMSADDVGQIAWIMQHPFEVRGGRLYGRLPVLDGRIRAAPDRVRKIIDQVFAGLMPHASPPREFRDGVAIIYEIEGVVDGMTVGVWGVLKDDYRDP